LSVGALLGPFVCLCQVAPKMSDIIPLEKGTTWTYSGNVAWQDGPVRVHRAHVTWKSEVVDSKRVGRFRVAALRGFPGDLTWYEPGTERGCYLVVIADNREVYVKSLIGPCEAPAVLIESEIAHENPLFKQPLRQGSIWGEDKEREQAIHDHHYAWYVESVRPAALSGIGGVPIAGRHTAYTLSYRTNPDHETLTWVPGIGLTHYIYSHHGTVSDVDVRLVSFHRP
jgi:hypothetical protein